MNSLVNYKIGLDIAEITSLVSVIKKEIANLKSQKSLATNEDDADEIELDLKLLNSVLNKIMEKNNNYLIQSNLFNETVLSDLSEIQKDILYYLQDVIDFRDKEATGEVYFDYNKFLEFKNTSRNLSYSPKEIQSFCKELTSLNGVIYNVNTENIEFFNIIDKVTVNSRDPENFIVRFASWGRIFFFEKFEFNLFNFMNEKIKKIKKALSY